MSDNDLEVLFNRQPPYDEAALTKIISHYRAARAQYLNGVKPKKEKGEVKPLTLDALGLGSAPAEIAPIKFKL